MPLNGRQMTDLITSFGRLQYRARRATSPAASTPTRPFRFPSPAAAAIPLSGAWTAATTRTTWPTATCPIRSRCGERIQRGIDAISARRMAATWAAWSTSSPSPGTNQYHGEGIRVHPQQLHRRHQLLLGDTRHAAPESVRRHVWRPHQTQQDVCIRGLSAHGRPTSRKSSTQATVPTAQNLTGNWSVTDGIPGVAGSNACNSTHAPIHAGRPPHGHGTDGKQICDLAPTYNPSALALQKYLPAINPARTIQTTAGLSPTPSRTC